MSSNGYINLHRSLLSWEWYSDVNTSRLFVHLILKVNYNEKKWQGKLVKKGQLITSVAKLSYETNLTAKQVRIALDKLKRTNEVAIKTTSQYTMIYVQNYIKYQEVEHCDGIRQGKPTANEGQTKGKPTATTKEGKKERRKEEEKKDISVNISKEKNTHEFKSPKLNDVFEFMQEYSASKDFTLSVNSESENFFDFYSSKGWKVGKETMKDWRSSARKWLRKNNDEKKKPEKLSFRSGKLVEDNTAKGTFDRVQKLREKFL